MFLLIFGVLCWGVVSFPQLHFIALKFPLMDFYSENIGFRFFWTARWVDGDANDFIHPGQGVLLPFIQTLYYILAKQISNDLYDRIFIFSNLTIIGITLSAFILQIFIACDSRLPWQVRSLLLTLPLAMSLTHQHMFSYHLYPDYLGYEKILLTLSYYLIIRQYLFGSVLIRDAYVIGILSGIVASLKINLGIFVLVWIILALKRKSYYFLFRSIIVALGSSVFVYFLLLDIYYGLVVHDVYSYFSVLSGMIGGEWFFDWNEISPFASWSNHSMSNLSWLLIFLFSLSLFVCLSSNQFAKYLSAITWVMSMIAAAMMVKRGGGSSYFDAVIICTLLISLLVSATYRKLSNFPLVTSVLLVCAASGIWTITHWQNYITNNGLLAAHLEVAWQRELQSWNEEKKLPIRAIFPSNSFAVGSLEDMMMRGFRNFGSDWSANNDNISFKKMFPGYKFGSYDMVLGDEPVLLEWVTSEQAFPLVNSSELAMHKAYINALIRNYKVGPCKSVAPPLLMGATIKSCVIQKMI